MQTANAASATLAAIIALSATLASASASATPCDQVSAQIDAKLKAKGVKAYTLEAIPVAEVKEQKVVGSCAVGTKKIVYRRVTVVAAAPQDVAQKPALATVTTMGAGAGAATVSTAAK